MSIPGQNLLNMALTMIHRQKITYYKYIGRVLNSVGQYVTTYEPPSDIFGSWQPVPRNLYAQYGLDFQKNYYTFYSLSDVMDLKRDITSDKVAYNSQLFQVESANDWFALDGWKGVLCVQIDEGIF